MSELPDFERPPVVEVLAAVQFVPIAQFGMREAALVARAFEGWDVVDVPPALEPIVEAPPGQPVTTSLRFGLGMPPVRLILQSRDGRWVAQVQQDRLAAHERRTQARPSFKNVKPKVLDLAQQTGAALGRPLLTEPHAPELVEVIYENHILAGDGWSGFSELDHVLRAVQPTVGEPPWDRVEQVSLGFAFLLLDSEEFRGRLRVTAEPAQQDSKDMLHLRLIARRFVQNRELDSVLEECHADVVRGFTAITTERMHKIWGRFQ
jgi:uncharacterized protein (TIGR04255 family)